jgi:YVTN family beta-propeller protein
VLQFRKNPTLARRSPRWLLALTLPAAIAGLVLGPVVSAHAAVGTLLYVPSLNGSTGGEVAVINTATNAEVADIQTPTLPGDTVVTPDGSQVWIGGGRSIYVASPTTDTVTTTISLDSVVPPTDSGSAGKIVFDSTGAYAYVLVSDNQATDLVKISTATDAIVGSVNVGNSAQSLAISPDGSAIYISSQSSDSVSVVDTVSLTVSSVIYTGASSGLDIAVSPDGSQVYVAYSQDFNGFQSDVVVISTATGTVTTRIPIGAYYDVLRGMAFSANGSTLYVPDAATNVVNEVSTATNTVTGTIGGFQSPVAITLDNAAGTAYVSNLNAGDGYIAVVDLASGTITDTIPGFDYPGATSIATNYYAFNGFFPPVSAPPALNEAKAGRAIPLRFSLDGNQGLNIFNSGAPSVQQVDCATGVPVNADTLTDADTSGNSGLHYDATTDTYTYVWKTDKAWSGTCQQFSLGLNDGSTHTATFQFK